MHKGPAQANHLVDCEIKLAIPKKSSPGPVRDSGELLAMDKQCILDTRMPPQTDTPIGLSSCCILREDVAATGGLEGVAREFASALGMSRFNARDVSLIVSNMATSTTFH
jgi:hypothetical protein